MDPITRASKAFLSEAAAHWKARRGHVLFMEADAASRGDLVKALRLAELSPSCRRPLFLFEGAFVEPAAYWEALAASMARDHEALRQGAAEEGVLLAGLDPEPRLEIRPNQGNKRGALAPALVGFRAREIGRALEGKLLGIDIALVPERLAAPMAFREAVAALAAELAGSGARLLVLSTPGGPLSELAEGRMARFHVDPDELANTLKNLGEPAPEPGAPGELRALLVSAAEASHQGDHAGAGRLFGQARAWCRSEGWAIEEAVVLVALAGACLAAGVPDKAAASFQVAFTLATRSEANSLAAQAALGQGAVRMQQRRYVEAVDAYAAAAEAAERGRAPMLQAEAWRMARTAALAAGREADALHAWKRAGETASAGSAAGDPRGI